MTIRIGDPYVRACPEHLVAVKENERTDAMHCPAGHRVREPLACTATVLRKMRQRFIDAPAAAVA